MTVRDLSAAISKVEAIHAMLVNVGILEALEYTILHDFQAAGRSLAAQSAGALVTLVGRNEGGKTLSRATVAHMSELRASRPTAANVGTPCGVLGPTSHGL